MIFSSSRLPCCCFTSKKASHSLWMCRSPRGRVCHVCIFFRHPRQKPWYNLSVRCNCLRPWCRVLALLLLSSHNSISEQNSILPPEASFGRGRACNLPVWHQLALWRWAWTLGLSSAFLAIRFRNHLTTPFLRLFTCYSYFLAQFRIVSQKLKPCNLRRYRQIFMCFSHVHFSRAGLVPPEQIPHPSPLPKCHCNQCVTLTGVTVSGKVCSNSRPIFLSSHFRYNF